MAQSPARAKTPNAEAKGETIDELHLKAQAMPVTEGRVIQVQLSYLRDFRRVRVIDDFETSYATTVAEVLVLNESAAEAVTLALQVRFGAQRVVFGEPFHPKDTVFRYEKS